MLYRFMSLDVPYWKEALVKAIRDQDFYVATFEQKNDPFEGAPFVSKDLIDIREGAKDFLIHLTQLFIDLGEEDPIGLKNMLIEKTTCQYNSIGSLNELSQYIKDSLRCFSLSQSINSIPMWGYYTRFSGACIECKSSEGLSIVGGTHPMQIQEVIYTNDKPVVTNLDLYMMLMWKNSFQHFSEKIECDANRLAVGFFDSNSVSLRSLFDKFALTKSKDWVPEREMRFLDFWGKGGYKNFPNLVPTRVIFGPKAEPGKLSVLKEELGKSIGYASLVLDEAEYKLRIIDDDNS